MSSTTYDTEKNDSGEEISAAVETGNGGSENNTSELHTTEKAVSDSFPGQSIGISAEDIKNVSQKAAETVNSIGSYLFGFANKAGQSLSVTVKKIKETVEETNILGDFKREQEAFVSCKSSENKGEALPPWSGSEDEEKLKQEILSLSDDKRNFLRKPPAGVQFDFSFDDMYPVAKTMLKNDPALEKMRFEIVPKLINEEEFWKNYFYRVQLIKNSSLLKSENSNSGSTVVSSNKDSKDGDWEQEMQQELQDYELIGENNEDCDWEKEMENMLDDKLV